MKRILISILPLVAAFFLTVSCDPTNKNNPEVQDTLTVSPASIDFEAEDASTKLVYVTTEKDWTATPSAAWIPCIFSPCWAAGLSMPAATVWASGSAFAIRALISSAECWIFWLSS